MNERVNLQRVPTRGVESQSKNSEPKITKKQKKSCGIQKQGLEFLNRISSVPKGNSGSVTMGVDY